MFLLIFILFNSFPRDAQQERHYLHYMFTAIMGTYRNPEFSAVAVYDDRQIKHFSDKERVWILTESDQTNAPDDPPDHRDWFIHQIRTLSNCPNSQCSGSPDVHIFATEYSKRELVLMCLATGFYPRDVQMLMFIRLDRTNLEDQTSSGIRPNDDETFQMSTSVKIDRNYEGSYDCLLIHSSLAEPVVEEWDETCIDCKIPEWIMIAGVAAVVLAVALIVAVPCLKVQKWYQDSYPYDPILLRDLRRIRYSDESSRMLRRIKNPCVSHAA
ncbi:H-2 class I histocompatibility antigen, D-37 alpha chain-like isoform X1 [Megalobrama amblycephala]|uniref:H-2 class I histocompatibility antigen, D-37 alpha chain-like isoform X1 n=1 Tax=Megalobrama amblycephala TaxID=75352 RepID=UPI0020143170|nr:H-2 class I histocompatibility antigen, D-37 alpha chain-like isoform X1 [Megalobrama amblycephala]